MVNTKRVKFIVGQAMFTMCQARFSRILGRKEYINAPRLLFITETRYAEEALLYTKTKARECKKKKKVELTRRRRQQIIISVHMS